MLLVVSDVPIDNEMHMVTSSISKFTGPTRFFGGAHMDRVYLCVFIRVSMPSCM